MAVAAEYFNYNEKASISNVYNVLLHNTFRSLDYCHMQMRETMIIIQSITLIKLWWLSVACAPRMIPKEMLVR